MNSNTSAEYQKIDIDIPNDSNDWDNIQSNYIPEYISQSNDQPTVLIHNSLKDNVLESVELDCPNINKKKYLSYMIPVAVAESITAGALSNALCSEPGSSKFFLGGVIAYNMKTQKTMLDVDTEYAEKNNFANPFTTFTMAKNVAKLFKSRIGISTTGFSLPTYRTADPSNGKCEISVDIPYAYICLYDALTDNNAIYKITNFDYSPDADQKIQRAQMQVKVAMYCKQLFEEYCLKQNNSNSKDFCKK